MLSLDLSPPPFGNRDLQLRKQIIFDTLRESGSLSHGTGSFRIAECDAVNMGCIVYLSKRYTEEPWAPKHHPVTRTQWFQKDVARNMGFFLKGMFFKFI